MDLIRVMLADDHPAFREGIRAQIEREADMVVIEEAENGKDAIELAAKLVPDVLVLDMELPLFSGLEVARELQARSIPTLVLPLSGFSSPEYVIGVLESGAPGYITKDESLKDITDAIRKIMKGGVYISSRVSIQIVNQERQKVRSISEKENARKQVEELGITTTLLRVLKLVAMGHTNKHIADVVCRSEHTVRNQVDKLKSLVDVRWRPALVAWSWKNGVMQMPTEDDVSDNGVAIEEQARDLSS
ncbi:MAG: response regulator transcription factor [Bacteroidetes bacterium]|nr:response regulator transcription factor [Bacteroidota bacterium]